MGNCFYSYYSIPTKCIKDMLQGYYNQSKIFLFDYNLRADKSLYLEKLKIYHLEAKKLFDIAASKCFDFNSCNYPELKKVPCNNSSFLLDQKNITVPCTKLVAAST